MFIMEAIYKNGQSATEYAKKIEHLLSQHHVVHCKGIEYTGKDLFNFYDEVSQNLGECIPIAEDYRTGETTGEKWIEIRFDPTIKNAYRHSKEPQPLHTDGSYISNAPNIFMMFCVNKAIKGGATIYIDGNTLIKQLRSDNPNLYQRIIDTPIRFSKADDSKTRPIITYENDQPIFTWNYYCVDVSEPDSSKEIVKEFHKYLQTNIVGSKYIHEILMHPGEAVCWHDERLLHGRNGFEADKANDRFLWKSGVNKKF